ncbi:unnamed protein product [Prunus armeniaca]|uniref:Uncharacterized protein n=1 Tax=Prunus armeniaca TaxID=36596 RepID=A0A6J5Y4Q2_PRUAR|nr:unnamed protein product [Prunus armeniaca]CAB4319377.1 unnamed protein product [Prunus armeniaca]
MLQPKQKGFWSSRNRHAISIGEFQTQLIWAFVFQPTSSKSFRHSNWRIPIPSRSCPTTKWKLLSPIGEVQTHQPTTTTKAFKGLHCTSRVQCTVVHRLDNNHTAFRNSPNNYPTSTYLSWEGEGKSLPSSQDIIHHMLNIQLWRC